MKSDPKLEKVSRRLMAAREIRIKIGYFVLPIIIIFSGGWTIFYSGFNFMTKLYIIFSLIIALVIGILLDLWLFRKFDQGYLRRKFKEKGVDYNPKFGYGLEKN